MHPVLHPGWGYDTGIQIEERGVPMKTIFLQSNSVRHQSPTDGGIGPTHSPTDGGIGPTQ